MKIHILPSGPVATNAYLLTDAQRHEAIVVDAPLGVCAPIEAILEAEGCKLMAILLTHGHWDHIADAHVLHTSTLAPIYAHTGDKVMFDTPGIMATLMPRNMKIEAPEIAHWVEQGTHLTFLGHTFEVRHVPGHSPGSILFYTPGLGAFCGDALFQGSIGRTDLPGGSFNTLKRSIREQIYTLPSSTAVYPGHGEPTEVGQEALHNPYVKKGGE